MKAAPMSNTAVAATTGTVALTFPAWGQFVVPAHQITLAALGLVVLILTIRAKWLEIRIARETLRKLREGGDT